MQCVFITFTLSTVDMPIAIKNHSYPPTLKIVLQYTASLFKKKERKKEEKERKRKKKKKKSH